MGVTFSSLESTYIYPWRNLWLCMALKAEPSCGYIHIKIYIYFYIYLFIYMYILTIWDSILDTHTRHRFTSVRISQRIGITNWSPAWPTVKEKLPGEHIYEWSFHTPFNQKSHMYKYIYISLSRKWFRATLVIPSLLHWGPGSDEYASGWKLSHWPHRLGAV